MLTIKNLPAYSGWAAGLLGTIYQIPQIIKLMTFQDSRGISVTSLVILTTAVFLWFLHGVYLKDRAMMVMNGMALSLNAITISLVVIFGT